MTRAMIRTSVCFLVLLSSALADDPPYVGIRLLDGYKYQRISNFDTINGVIYKDGGLRIEFEAGISEGYAVSSKDKANYMWFREQMVNGHRVFLALTESGTGTRWEPKHP